MLITVTFHFIFSHNNERHPTTYVPKLYYILFLLMILGLNACEDPLASDGTETRELYLEATLKPDSLPRASLRTTEIYNTKGQEVIIAVEDMANIRLKNLVSNDQYEFVYEGDGEYVIAHPNLIQEGDLYSITASLNDHPEFKEVSSEVEVPMPNVIQHIEHNEPRMVELVEGSDGFYKKYTYNLNITIAPQPGQDYYRLEPRATLHFLNVDQDSFFIRNPNDIEYFSDFYGGDATADQMHDLEHMDGVLINLAEADNNTVNLIFSSTWELQENVDYLPFINFRLHTLSDSYYNYNLSKSKVLISTGTGSAQPVTSYTNIESGRGGFTALSTSVDTFVVSP